MERGREMSILSKNMLKARLFVMCCLRAGGHWAVITSLHHLRAPQPLMLAAGEGRGAAPSPALAGLPLPEMLSSLQPCRSVLLGLASLLMAGAHAGPAGHQPYWSVGDWR